MKPSGEIKTPSIFEYTDYRKFLRELYDALKATKPQFSFRYFSRQAGFRSPNFLKLVIEGKRNLSDESIEKFAKALKLKKEETRFFRNLVLLNQAATVDQKTQYAEQLLRSRPFRKLNPLKPAQHACYSHWYLIPIRELVDTASFREDPAWIARRLSPPVTAQEAERAIATLLELGMLKRDVEGRLAQSDAFVSTGDEVTSTAVAQFHREMLRKAEESIDRHAREARDISSLTLGLSEDGAKRVKEMIQKFRKELLAVAQADRAEGVYQVNFQFFPLTRKLEEES